MAACTGCGSARGGRAVKGRAILGITISHFPSRLAGRGPATPAAGSTRTGVGGGSTFTAGRLTTSIVRRGAGRAVFGRDGAGLAAAVIYTHVTGKRNVAPYSRRGANIGVSEAGLDEFSTSLLLHPIYRAS